MTVLMIDNGTYLVENDDGDGDGDGDGDELDPLLAPPSDNRDKLGAWSLELPLVTTCKSPVDRKAPLTDDFSSRSTGRLDESTIKKETIGGIGSSSSVQLAGARDSWPS